MKKVECWLWMIWNLQGTKMTKTRYLMDEATALERHPEAVKVPGTMVLREVCETDEERWRHTNTKPPTTSGP